MIHELMGIFE